MSEEKSQFSYAIQKRESTALEIAISASKEKIASLLPKAAERISRDIEIEGFRKGKAPYEIVRQKVGEFHILEEAARMAVASQYAAIIKEIEEKEYAAEGKHFEPVGDPEISITKLAVGEALEYRVRLVLLPSVALPDYRAIAKKAFAKAIDGSVPEEEVKKAIEWFRESRTKLVTVDRSAEKGDRVEVSFHGTANGEAVEGLDSENHPLVLGEGKFIPGFEDALLGLKAGEEKAFAIDAPKDYPSSSVAGKRLEFKAAMKLVQKREIPEWNDAFASSVGAFASVEEAEKSLREGMQKEKKQKERERRRVEVIGEIAGKSKIELPPPLVDREVERMMAELRSSVERAGAEMGSYLLHIKKTEEMLKKDLRPDAERRVNIALALRAIARAENVELTDEEARVAFARALAEHGMNDADLKAVDREQVMDYTRGIARNEKVFALLESYANE